VPDQRALAYQTPRREIAGRVPPGTRRLLDLGCAAGGLATLLPGVEVVGVELDQEYAAAAEQSCARVIHADVEQLAHDGLEGLGRFDCVVAADVLEHLVDPWSALRAYAGLLEPGGTAVISLPNVGHWSTYAARELVEQAGLAVATVDRRPRLIWRGSRLDELLGPPILRLPGVRTLVTFQHVLTAYPARA
jgi:2-polyprenyl-3-methyl-5-hydroxy-6-metoxy-1,4-benzoquinol methylase